MRSKEAPVIAVGNQKGGVGKTTNTVHLAAALADQGFKCLVWDLDMNHGATRHFGIEADAFLGTFEVLMGVEDATDVIITGAEDEPCMPEGIHILPSNRRLEGLDEAIASKNRFLVKQEVLLRPLEQLRQQYDYIFLDTAPNATTPTIAAYRAADHFLLSAMPDPFAVAGLQDALKDIKNARDYGNPKLNLLGVLISGVANHTRLAAELTAYIEQTFTLVDGKRLKFETEISRSTVVPQAQREGTTLFQLHPSHKVTEQYRALAQEFLVRVTPAAPNSTLKQAS